MRRAGVGSESGIRGRVLEPEMMDDPGLDPERHAAALRGLARINTLSLAWRGLAAEIRRTHARIDRPVRVVDIAGGGGDVLLRAVAASRVPVDPLVVDVSEVAIGAALHRARARGASLDVLRCDVLSGALPRGDLVTCSLFLHHLERDTAVQLLERMRSAAGTGVFVNDLRRSRAGTALAWVVPRVLTRSGVVHRDAVISTRAAWTADELRSMAESAGYRDARVRSVLPCRMELVWSREG